MGMSASQVRFLSLQHRKHNVGRQLNALSNRKMSLARDMQQVSRNYTNALNQIHFKFSNDCGITNNDLTYDRLMKPNELNCEAPLILTDKQGRVVLDDTEITYQRNGEPINTGVTYRQLAQMISAYSGVNSNGDLEFKNKANLDGIEGSIFNTEGELNPATATSGRACDVDNGYKIIQNSAQYNYDAKLRYTLLEKLGMIDQDDIDRFDSTVRALYGNPGNEPNFEVKRNDAIGTTVDETGTFGTMKISATGDYVIEGGTAIGNYNLAKAYLEEYKMYRNTTMKVGLNENTNISKYSYDLYQAAYGDSADKGVTTRIRDLLTMVPEGIDDNAYSNTAGFVNDFVDEHGWIYPGKYFSGSTNSKTTAVTLVGKSNETLGDYPRSLYAGLWDADYMDHKVGGDQNDIRNQGVGENRAYVYAYGKSENVGFTAQNDDFDITMDDLLNGNLFIVLGNTLNHERYKDIGELYDSITKAIESIAGVFADSNMVTDDEALDYAKKMTLVKFSNLSNEQISDIDEIYNNRSKFIDCFRSHSIDDGFICYNANVSGDGEEPQPNALVAYASNLNGYAAVWYGAYDGFSATGFSVSNLTKTFLTFYNAALESGGNVKCSIIKPKEIKKGSYDIFGNYIGGAVYGANAGSDTNMSEKAVNSITNGAKVISSTKNGNTTTNVYRKVNNDGLMVEITENVEQNNSGVVTSRSFDFKYYTSSNVNGQFELEKCSDLSNKNAARLNSIEVTYDNTDGKFNDAIFEYYDTDVSGKPITVKNGFVGQKYYIYMDNNGNSIYSTSDPYKDDNSNINGPCYHSRYGYTKSSFVIYSNERLYVIGESSERYSSSTCTNGSDFTKYVYITPEDNGVESRLKSLVNYWKEQADEVKGDADEGFSSTEQKVMMYFDSLLKRISENGWVYDEKVNNQGNQKVSAQYLDTMLQNNQYFITEVREINDAGRFQFAQKQASSVDKIYKIHDEDAENEALAKYEADKTAINLKERQIDTRMAMLETEQEAINTEMESIKKVKNDNIDKFFKIFA